MKTRRWCVAGQGNGKSQKPGLLLLVVLIAALVAVLAYRNFPRKKFDILPLVPADWSLTSSCFPPPHHADAVTFSPQVQTKLGPGFAPHRYDPVSGKSA